MIRKCLKCGKKNRIPAKHLADQGRCGSCKETLPPIAEPVDVDASTFDEIVNGATVPLLIDFWAVWCKPCKMAAPEVKQVATEMAGRAIVLKVDTDASPELGQRFNVLGMGIPNFVVMNHGQVIHQKAGLVDHRQMVSWLMRAAT